MELSRNVQSVKTGIKKGSAVLETVRTDNMKMPRHMPGQQTVEKVQRKLGFFAFMWYNIGEGS
jgi:hypothetical protein